MEKLDFKEYIDPIFNNLLHQNISISNIDIEFIFFYLEIVSEYSYLEKNIYKKLFLSRRYVGYQSLTLSIKNTFLYISLTNNKSIHFIPDLKSLY